MDTTDLITLAYGEHPLQRGDLALPRGRPAGVVVLLHGGFWRAPHGRAQLEPLVEALRGDGFAVWNLGYRTIGDGGGWPETGDDVAAGIGHLAKIAERFELPLDRVIVAGHSAGGHLALWSGSQGALAGIRLRAVAGLAPVADLSAAHDLDLGRGAVAELLGSSDHAARLAFASPRHMLPLGVPQFVVHGEEDQAVPADLSRSYADAARHSGDEVTLVCLAGAGHMDFLDPESDAAKRFRAWLREIV